MTHAPAMIGSSKSSVSARSSPLNLPSSMAEHASQLYARNVASLLELMTGEDGAVKLDFEDAIISGACVTRGGEIVHEAARKAAEGA